MREWKTSSRPGDLTLEEFVEKVRGSKSRMAKLQEDLDWVIHEMFAIPGPVYGEAVRSTNVKPDRIIELLDKRDRIERKIIELVESEKLLQEFINTLTIKEKNVFHLRYFKRMSQQSIAYEMCISQQAVCQYIDKINKKWGNVPK